MEKNTRISLFAGFVLASALCLASCQKEEAFTAVTGPDLRSGVSFSLDEVGALSIQTRSLLTSSDIETKKTSVTLAAYRGGTLQASGYYTTGLTQMSLELVSGETYNIYAFVNMGSLVSVLPSSESGLSGVSYNIPSWQSVDASGLPMTGVLTSFVAGSSSSTQIPVTRRFAKVTATLTCNWPGAVITGAVVGNMNGRIPLAGAAAMTGASDALSWQDSDTGGSSSATMTFYVPENMQGTVSGISASRDKSHEFNATVNANRSKLTYLEVSVSAGGAYSGSVTYRSYLGANATTNFDVAGNTRYVWTINYGEDGLAEDTWKVDTDNLNDNRTFAWNANPIYVEPGQTVTFADWYTTNITSGIDVSLSGSDLSDVVSSSGSTGFSVKAGAAAGKSVTATAQPSRNPIQSLVKATVFMVRRWVAEWKGYDQTVYANEGRKVYVVSYQGGGPATKSVTASVDYWQNPGGSPQRGLGEQAPGSSQGAMWTYSVPSGMSASYSSGNDEVAYTVPKSVHPGDHMILSSVKADGHADTAYVRVVDTRFLYWFGRIVQYPGGGMWFNYNSSDVSINNGQSLNITTMKNNSTPSNASNNFFLFSDETSVNPVFENNYQSQPVIHASQDAYPVLYGNPIYNSFVSSLNSELEIIIPSTLSFASGPSFASYSVNNMSYAKLGYITGTLSSLPATAGPHVVRIQVRDNPSIGINIAYTFDVQSATTYVERLVLSPTQASINVGSTHAFNSVTLVTETYESGVLVSTVNTPLALNQAGLSWQSSDTSIATVSQGSVTGVASGSAIITATYSAAGLHNGPVSATCNITVNSDGVTIESGWTNGGSTILNP